MTRKPEDRVSTVQNGNWPSNEDANNPYKKEIDRDAMRKQESGEQMK